MIIGEGMSDEVVGTVPCSGSDDPTPIMPLRFRECLAPRSHWQ
jgi:hypothetical protein